MLEGKVIIVTGAAGGIGSASAEALAGAGATVVIADRTAECMVELQARMAAAGDAPLAVAVDITDEAQVKAMVEEVIARYGRLDGAFNNAGVEQLNRELHDIPLDEWNRVVSIDLTGAFLCMKHQIRAMLAGGHGGSIVNTASGLGLVVIPQASEYIAAKHGVIGLTKAAAVEYGTRGIRVNAVLPGVIHTAMTERIFADHMDLLISRHPIGRIGRPIEIAEAAKWLLSDASSFVTGVALPVDGGYIAV